MINKIKNLHINEYVFTIVVTCVVVFTLCCCIELVLLFKLEDKVNTEELNVQNLSKFCTIEQLEKRLKSEPNNYFVSIRIAQIYESLNEFSKAKDYFENALKLSGRSDYSVFSYAMFCARRNAYFFAASLAEELSGNNKKTVEYKAKIYEILGDNFTSANEFEAAVKAYQVAYKYAKNCKDVSFKKSLSAKYAHSFVNLADYYMKNKDVESAILALNNSVNIKNSLVAKYKLALIYQSFDKKMAEKYFAEIFRRNPFMINPYVYNSLLTDIISEEKNEGKYSTADYYTTKLDRFKKSLQNIYVYKNDVLIVNSKITKSKKILSKDKSYHLTFSLKNNTKFKLAYLIVKVEIFVNSDRYVVEKAVIQRSNMLEPFSDISELDIKLPDNITFTKPAKNDIVLKYYVKKVKNAPWTLAKIDLLNF